ncbi:MAG TPA: HEPN domain-containing protein [Beijerinckiaceae bacterium]|nr:HEPN domain-containing protein [Beijerinckiaceae bacterium]
MAASDIEHARALLEMAKRDHRALSRMLDPQDFAEEIFGFHAQQVVEKALKAWIAAKALAYPKSHDLTALTKILERSGEPLHGISGLTDLTAFAVQYRYESYDELDDALDREHVIEQTAKLVEHVTRVVRPAASGDG